MPKMGSLISGFLGTIVSPIANYFTRRAELNAQNHQLQLKVNEAVADRKIALISQGDSEIAAWEQKSLQNSGWRGSYELIVLSIPAILCFTPWYKVVGVGFDNLSRAPTWFQGLLVTVFLANYGIRYGANILALFRKGLGGNS